MKKKFLLLIVLLNLNTFYSQNIKYGLYFGFNAYDIEIEGPYSASGATSNLNIGLFGDYQINNRFGIKSNIFLNKTKESHYSVNTNLGYISDIFGDVTYSSVQLQALTKFDVRNNYDSGFYLLAGFRLTQIGDVSFEENNDFEDELLNKSNFGALLGFGTTITKYANFEITADRNISNPFKLTDDNSKNFGIYANFNINLSAFIKEN